MKITYKKQIDFFKEKNKDNFSIICLIEEADRYSKKSLSIFFNYLSVMIDVNFLIDQLKNKFTK